MEADPPEAAPDHRSDAAGARNADPPRRVLRFVLSPLRRLQRGGGSTEPQQLADQQRRRPGLRSATGGTAAESDVCGCSSDDEYSDDVLGSSPFASCADLQEYRRQLANRRAARTRRDEERRRQERPGPLRRVVQWVVHSVRFAARCVSPQGMGNNDTTLGERVVNVLTSLPFIAVGLHSLWHPSNGPARRSFGASFVATGLIAAGYHASTGAVREVMRKLDYWSIALTSCVLRRAAGVRAPAAVGAAAVLLTPYKPTAVTAANLAAIEGRYLLSALRHAHLRPTFGCHVGAATVGLTLFALEDVLVMGLGAPPVVHSLWHLLSSLSLGLVGPLLSHCEGALLLEGVQVVATGS